MSGVTQLKSSVQKGIKNKLVEQFPNLENYIDEIVPKKDNLRIVKWYERYAVILLELIPTC